MGLKEFFTIKIVYFLPSNIPFFHADGIKTLPFIKLYFYEVIEFPRGIILKREF